MKLIIVIAFISVLSLSSYAQGGDGFDKKQVKKELRGYLRNPAEYYREKQNLTKQNTILQGEIVKKDAEIGSLKNEVSTVKGELSSAKDENAVLNQKLTAAESAKKVFSATGDTYGADRTYSNSASSSNGSDGGTVYRVQIAASKVPNYTKPVRLSDDVNQRFDGRNYVYDVKDFNNPEDAYEYAMNLRKTGVIPDAFVTKYVNGSRDFGFSYNPQNIGKGGSTSSYYSSTNIIDVTSSNDNNVQTSSEFNNAREIDPNTVLYKESYTNTGTETTTPATSTSGSTPTESKKSGLRIIEE